MRFMKIFFFVCIGLVLVGCSDYVYEDLMNNIAEVRQFLLEGSNESGRCTLVCGIRESDYVLNGVATEGQEFGVVSFYLNEIEYNKEYNFRLKTPKEEYMGYLEKNPYDGSLVADIGKIIDYSEYVVAEIIIDEKEIGFSLNSISDNFKIDYMEVIKNFSNIYKKELKSIKQNNKFKAELYVKIIEDVTFDGKYYWQVKVISTLGDSITALISVENGNVMASNINLISK